MVERKAEIYVTMKKEIKAIKSKQKDCIQIGTKFAFMDQMIRLLDEIMDEFLNLWPWKRKWQKDG